MFSLGSNFSFQWRMVSIGAAWKVKMSAVLTIDYHSSSRGSWLVDFPVFYTSSTSYFHHKTQVLFSLDQWMNELFNSAWAFFYWLQFLFQALWMLVTSATFFKEMQIKYFPDHCLLRQSFFFILLILSLFFCLFHIDELHYIYIMPVCD